MAGFSASSPLSPDRRRELLFAVLFLTVPLVLLAAAEGAAHIIRENLDRDRVDWTAVRTELGAPSQDRLYLFRPNSQHGYLQINSLGLRSPEISTPKPDGTRRIAFVGNSVTLGASLPEGETFPAITTHLLAAHFASCQLDYATFAGPGYSTGFIAENWPPLREKIQPDVVVLLAGGPSEIASRLRAPVNATEPSWLSSLAVVDLGRRFLQRYSLANLLPSSGSGNSAPDVSIEALLEETGSHIDETLGTDTALIVGARGRIRSGNDEAAHNRSVKALQKRLPQDFALGPIALTEATLAMLTAKADAPNRRFSNAINEVTPSDTNYADQQHLTAQGHSRLASLLATELIPLLQGCDPELD